jgi:hypothetical protein
VVFDIVCFELLQVIRSPHKQVISQTVLVECSNKLPVVLFALLEIGVS